jgi:hypothetical protein
MTTETRSSPGLPCDRDLPVISERVASMRPYEVLSHVSVSCGVGLAQPCDDKLRAGACAAGADAVVVVDAPAEPGGLAPSRSAMLVRWRVADAGID